MDYKAAAAQLKEALRLRTEPFGAIFFKDPADLPPKTRQPSKVFGKKVTICQGVTMARVYGWPVGLTQDDLICVPGMLVFGFTPATDPIMELGQLFCEVGFHPDLGPALKEVEALPRFEPQEVGAIYLCPLERLTLDPDVVVVYGNPAQLMRLIQAATFSLGERVSRRIRRQGGMQRLSHRPLPFRGVPGGHPRHGRPHLFHDPGRRDGGGLPRQVPGRAPGGAERGRPKRSGPATPSPFTRTSPPAFHRPMKNGPGSGGSL